MGLPTWFNKVSSAWLMLGALLAGLAAQGLLIPPGILDLFSEAFIKAVEVALASTLSLWQVIRIIIAKFKKDGLAPLSKKPVYHYLLPHTLP